MLPLLYLHGLSSGDFVPALGQFLGSTAGLSASVITRLTETWKAEQRTFAARDHIVTQSCYATDPDGHTIEVTWACPREEWQWTDEGLPVVVATPIALQDLLNEPGASTPASGGIVAGPRGVSAA